METSGIREARANLPRLVERVEAEPVVLTRHGRKVAALLPAEAAEVWERHLAEQEEQRRAREEEATLGRRLPGKRGAVCPYCGSAYMKVVYSGPVVAALVNLADPGAGIQAVTVDTDPVLIEQMVEIRCASCAEEMNERPRKHGHPAYRAAADIADDAHWPKDWEAGDMYRAHDEKTRASRITVEHDLARGAIKRVTFWEWFTGVTDEEREQIRAERAAAGLTDDDPW